MFAGKQRNQPPHQTTRLRNLCRRFAALAAVVWTVNSAAGETVWTYHNNNARTGANTNETRLTLANVNTNTFGRLLKYEVDGYVYTQPLYLPGVNIPGRGTRNVVYVASENDRVYAFDADDNHGANGGRLWEAALGEGINVVTNHEFGGRYHNNVLQDMLPRVGITGTPVIDTNTGTLLVVALTRTVTTTTNYYQHLHALDLATGAERPGSPVLMRAAYPGTGVGSSNGVVTFDARNQNQRCALTLAGGIVYVAYSSYADTDPYHGWIIGFDAATLQPLTNYVYNTTPDATTAAFGPHAAEGALWMGGNGLCVDANTNLFYEVANGSFDADAGGRDYGDSFMRLTTAGGLAVADYFTPFNQAAMQASDSDLGSGGPVLLPDDAGSAAHPHLIVGGGKEGRVYLVDRDHMGHYNPTNNQQIVESFAADAGSFFSTPAYFNHTLYYQGVRGVMKAFAVSNGYINPTPLSASPTSFSGFGTTPSVSANGVQDAIVWAIQSDGATRGGPAILHAYNATNLAQELYNSRELAGRDNPGNAVKMTVPTIADGRVFVGTQDGLAIFGLGVFLPKPVITPLGGDFANAVTVTLAEDAPGVSLYYTLDDTTPTADSTRYTGPFAITNTANLKVVALKPGAVDSGVATAAFNNTAAAGHGGGLTGEYWAGGANPDAPATLTRTDPEVDANGSDAGPGTNHFSARWSGAVQAQYSESYTFTTITRGGVRLRLNGRLLIDDWTDHPDPATNHGTLPLAAQQLYNVQMDYLPGNGEALAQLGWSSPSTAFELIPRTQLYPAVNPPPTVTLVRPAGGATYSGTASVTLGAETGTPHNTIGKVDFYANDRRLGTLSNSIYAPVYALTGTGFSAGDYTLAAVATDGSGLAATSAPVRITITPGSGRPYGLTSNRPVRPFLNLPTTANDPLPPLLSATGIFADTASRTPAGGLIPYGLNLPMWSDGAVASGWLAVPNPGGPPTPDVQLRLHPTNSWTFPAGTVFVKNLDMIVDERDTNTPRRRLETQVLVRDLNGAVYGATYKWRADNREADLLTTALTEDLFITNATGIRTQTWYYASPADCLTCHTPAAGFILGVNTRQLNGDFTYPATGVTDNQIRTLNRLGLFSPAINEADIAAYPKLSPPTAKGVSLDERARSYLDANCAQCHRPGGAANFDARYDTPPANQHLVNAPAGVSLGYPNAEIIMPGDIWRSVLHDRLATNAPTIRMPPLGRNRIDAQAVQLIRDWITSLPKPAAQ